MSKSLFSSLQKALKAMILPILTASYPVLFLYGNNVTKLILPSLMRNLALYIVISVLFFGISVILFKGQVIKAANATFVVLIFFNLYGIVYGYLAKADWFRVEHYMLLPLFVLSALYTSWIVSKVESVTLWNSAVIILGVLIVFNLFKIIPGEIQKQQIIKKENIAVPVVTGLPANNEYPDIYFIIFDEFAGFDTMRNYWHYHGVDDFANFAKSKGFFVVEHSKSNSLATFHQLAERMNYKEYPIVGSDDVNVYFNDIYDNQVMRDLKAKGYTTVSFEETDHFFGGFTQIKADYLFNYDDNKMENLGILFDEFGVLVADNTMLRAFSNRYKILDPTLEQHRVWINFTADNIGRLDIQSPKFVYVHFILPHYPFMFTENGNPVDPSFYYNWDYYLGTYQYSIQIAERMIENILSNADSQKPPIIIIQSDHGARNLQVAVSGSKAMDNYPDEYKYHILNMMYIPGYDTSQIPQDMNPINTFPILFNYLFGDQIPLVK